jgi:hypothetical protein
MMQHSRRYAYALGITGRITQALVLGDGGLDFTQRPPVGTQLGLKRAQHGCIGGRLALHARQLICALA